MSGPLDFGFDFRSSPVSPVVARSSSRSLGFVGSRLKLSAADPIRGLVAPFAGVWIETN